VNTKTGAVIFNFTGTGSVQDAATAQKLSEALNQQGIDDIYTKLTIQLVVPTTATTAAATTPAAVATSAPATPVQTTAKSPISPLLAVAGLGIACLAVFAMKRR
jgi:alcohol dehydrogenase class IV